MKKLKKAVQLSANEKIMLEALAFYANPENYMAIGFFPDPPCGEFIHDFSKTAIGIRPGKKAREALRKVIKG